MTRLRTVALLALVVIPAAGCGGDSSPTRPMTAARALVSFTVPQEVVAVPSTDPRYAMEATIPVVARESAGVNAYITTIRVDVTNETAGAGGNSTTVRLNSVGTIPGGGSVEIPLRVFVSTNGTFRAKVMLSATDSGGLSNTGNSGGENNGNPSVTSYFESGEFRILPPL